MAERQEIWDFESVPTIDAHTQDYWVKVGRATLRMVGEVVRASGDKQGAVLAADVKANPTQFSEALKVGGPKRFAVEWLGRVVVADAENKILRFLCALKRMRPVPFPVEKPEEKLRRLVARIESKGSMGRELLREEFGSEADDLVRSALGEDAP